MNEQKYKEDLKDIRDIMQRSSRFQAVSGLSFISIGVIGLAGAFVAYYVVFSKSIPLTIDKTQIPSDSLGLTLIIAVVTLLAALLAVAVFTMREAKRLDLDLWDLQTKRMVINLAIPLVTGGIICLFLLQNGFLGMVPPVTLIFYGLALLHVSKYSLEEIRTLGIVEIILGLTALYFVGYGIWFWMLGFGVAHIIFGFVVQSRYRS